jgi:hypothetical protein
MEKFLKAIENAQNLGITPFYCYDSLRIKKSVLEDSPKGKARRNKEINFLMRSYANEIMDSRDDRIRMQRELLKLLDIEVWEPENFTDEMREQTKELRAEIKMCKLSESNWEIERARLEELI